MLEIICNKKTEWYHDADKTKNSNPSIWNLNSSVMCETENIGFKKIVQ
jgi:hypothetical protein